MPMARCQREAEERAALNHPNIGEICGLEKTPEFTALVMESRRLNAAASLWSVLHAGWRIVLVPRRLRRVESPDLPIDTRRPGT